MTIAPRCRRGWRDAASAAAGAACLVVAMALLAAPARSAAAGPRCAGAAALDPALGCANMTRSVTPRLDVLEVGARCDPVPSKLDSLCAFGVASSRASRHVVLIGDSHAMNWRGAMQAVARDRRWRVYSIAMPGCLFSAAVSALPEGRREPCTEWYRLVRSWLYAHPEVSIVFASHNALAPVEPGAGERYSDIMLAGWTRAWQALPGTVEKVVVLRDAPDPSDGTLRCLRRVVAAGTQRPGPACATPRSDAVRWDSAVSAAIALHSRRYRFIDLTSSFCDVRSCYPVIGGVRVYSDVSGHFTTPFSRTLGPYLLREMRRLIAAW
jgi:hypothetical protein